MRENMSRKAPPAPEASAPYEQRTKRRISRNCPFVTSGFKEIDYKDAELLRKFLTEKGKVLPRRVTGVSAYFQRKLTAAIKRARQVALLPFVGSGE